MSGLMNGLKVGGAIALPLGAGAYTGTLLGEARQGAIARRGDEYDAKLEQMTPGEQIIYGDQRDRPEGSGVTGVTLLGSALTIGGVVTGAEKLARSNLGGLDRVTAIAGMVAIAGVGMLGSAAGVSLRYALEADADRG